MKRIFLITVFFAGIFVSGNASVVNMLDACDDNCELTSEEEEYKGPLNIELGTRLDYQREYLDGDAIREHNGFRGKYLMLVINGNIGKRFAYSYRQRLNELKKDQSFFDGIDFMNLTYKFNPRWDVTAGKMALAVGSWEYDRNPMYVYNFSEWLNYLSCFKFGVSVGYNVTGKDRLVAQVTESPFNEKNDLYGYHLAWFGNHDWLHTIYSANVLEYRPGKFIYYLCLGHRLELNRWTVELDYVNRATERHAFFFKDCSVVGEVAYAPSSHWSILAKGSYTVNNSHDASDVCVMPGTEISQVTGGVEFFPLKGGNRAIRFHAICGYNFGTNTKADAVVQDKQLIMSAGVQFNMDLVKLVKNICKK